MTSTNGLILLDKPTGITSFRSLGPVKKQLGTKKVGHTGTLDQFASGMILALSGSMTKMNPFFMDFPKTYETTIRFGLGTDTLDPTGNIVDKGLLPAEKEVLAVLNQFHGTINQVPPDFSALKIKGKRASDRIRNGETIELSPRKVTIYDSVPLSFQGSDFSLKIDCSKGTYIRALARDIAKELGTCAHLKTLRRTAIGPFGLDSIPSGQDFTFLSAWEIFSRLESVHTVQVSSEDSLPIKRGHPPKFSSDYRFGVLTGLFDEQRNLLGAGQFESESSWQYLFVTPS